jgi:predicted nucleotidyltransferase
MIEIEGTTETFKQDIDRAVRILKNEGCTEIYLFGSVATGQVHAGSDIDLAVRGCPPGQFFHTLGRLLRELDHPVDLIDLDVPDIFVRYLLTSGELARIG